MKQPIQSQENGRCVTAASSQPRADRNPFIDVDAHPFQDVFLFEQQASSLISKILLASGNRRVIASDFELF